MFDCYQALILSGIIVDTIGLLYLFFMMPKGELKLISGRLVCEGKYSQGEYSQSENFFSGGWTSNSGGTSYEAGVVPEYCLSSSKWGKCYL